MWIAIIEIVVGLLMLVGLYYWLSKKSAKAKSQIPKNNIDGHLRTDDITKISKSPKKAISK